MGGYIETYRGVVAAWECDHYGHMNVQFYIGRISDAAATLLACLGLPSDVAAARGLGFAALNQNIDYRRELLAGDVVVMRSGVGAIDGRKIVFRHRLYNAATGELAMTATVLGVLLDLAGRRAVPPPPEFSAAAAAVAVGADDAPPPFLAPERGWLPSQRNCVNAWECDRMGHLNVQHYVARAIEADAVLAAAAGLTPALARRERIGLVPAEYRIQFKRELRAGAVTAGRSGVRAADRDHIAAALVIENGESGTVAATVEAALRCVDGASGEWQPLPQVVRDGAAALAATFGGEPPPAPQGPPAPSQPVAGMAETCRGSVNSWDTGPLGFATARFFMARYSDAAPQLLGAIGLSAETMRRRNWGSAALDYHMRFLRPLRAGDAVVVRSALLALREKTWRFCHVVSDAERGDVVAGAEIVAVLFDLGSRKSFVIPDEVRRQAEPCLLAGHAAAS